MLPTAGHYPQRDKPEEVAKVIRMALTGQLPDREDEDEFMRSYGASRALEDAALVGHTKIESPGLPQLYRIHPVRLSSNKLV